MIKDIGFNFLPLRCLTINNKLFDMKKQNLFISFLFLISLSVTLFTSCMGCAEEGVSRMYDVNVDLDGDGDSGDRSGKTNSDVSFRSKIHKSCNKDDHDCTAGIDTNNDGWCDVCEGNGYYCPMAHHH